MDAKPPVRLEETLAEQLGQLASGLTPHQIHLKETILGVEKAKSPHCVEVTLCLDRRHTELVAADLHRCLERRHQPFTIESRQAGSEPPLTPQNHCSRRQEACHGTGQ